jgi:hypothetical protein
MPTASINPVTELLVEKPITVTVAVAKKLSGLGNTTIWSLIKNGTLETICVGRRRLILYRALEQLLTPAATNQSGHRETRVSRVTGR